MTRTIELPKNNKFIINNNDIATIIGKEAHTIYLDLMLIKDLNNFLMEITQKLN